MTDLGLVENLSLQKRGERKLRSRAVRQPLEGISTEKKEKEQNLETVSESGSRKL